MLSKTEHLLQTIKSFTPTYEGWLRELNQENPNDTKRGAGIIWYQYQRLALKAYFVDNDIVQCKQHYYTCAKIDHYLILNFDSRVLEYGMSHIAYALLSDHKGLIRQYADLSHRGYEKITKRGSIIYAIQLAIKDKLYDDYVEKLDQLSQKKSGTTIRPDVLFFRSLIEKDQYGCEEAINELLTPRRHKQRNKYMDLVGKFISHPAIGYAKLAWMKGIEVEIDHPFAPKDLLPINPNDQYIDAYDFLK